MQSYRETNSQPPRHVYSAVVENTTNSPVVVRGVYQTPPDAHSEPFEFTVPVGAKVTVEQKLVEVGTMTMTGHIERLEVVVDGAAVAGLTAPHGVWSPVKEYPFVIRHEGTAFFIDQPLRHPNAGAEH